MELHAVGRDELGRRVYLLFAPDFADINNAPFPAPPFVLLLGGPTQNLPVELVYSTIERLLTRGAAYIMCWGEGANRCEDIADEAAVMSSIDNPHAATILTTAHDRDSLDEVLDFATTVAVPAEPLAERCRDVVLVFHGNVHWYNQAQILLEDMLGGGAA